MRRAGLQQYDGLGRANNIGMDRLLHERQRRFHAKRLGPLWFLLQQRRPGAVGVLDSSRIVIVGGAAALSGIVLLGFRLRARTKRGAPAGSGDEEGQDGKEEGVEALPQLAGLSVSELQDTNGLAKELPVVPVYERPGELGAEGVFGSAKALHAYEWPAELSAEPTQPYIAREGIHDPPLGR
ncbi:hypothetical protein GGR56DRAFT_677818 [Xylariaceae sp. FL0804]|nr:hypothetical protein GGR56DRAFT_677818 [Xylariaceae sp. FL0804]